MCYGKVRERVFVCISKLNEYLQTSSTLQDYLAMSESLITLLPVLSSDPRTLLLIALTDLMSSRQCTT